MTEDGDERNSNNVVSSHSASRAFHSILEYPKKTAWIENRERSLLSMRFMLLGYIFESRPNSRALGTVGSVTTIGLSINRCSYTTIDWREVPEVRDASISFPKAAILLVSTMDHYPLVESEKKHLWLADKNVFITCKRFCKPNEPWARDKSFVYTPIWWLKTVKKKVYLDKSRNHATMSFVMCAVMSDECFFGLLKQSFRVTFVSRNIDQRSR